VKVPRGCTSIKVRPACGFGSGSYCVLCGPANVDGFTNL
jgi:hypothetical protein